MLRSCGNFVKDEWEGLRTEFRYWCHHDGTFTVIMVLFMMGPAVCVAVAALPAFLLTWFITGSVSTAGWLVAMSILASLMVPLVIVIMSIWFVVLLIPLLAVYQCWISRHARRNAYIAELNRMNAAALPPPGAKKTEATPEEEEVGRNSEKNQ